MIDKTSVETSSVDEQRERERSGESGSSSSSSRQAGSADGWLQVGGAGARLGGWQAATII